MEKLQSALIDVERHLDTLESVLENKLQRAVTMLQNAYGEGKQVSARIRASAQSVQVAGDRGDTEISTEPGGRGRLRYGDGPRPGRHQLSRPVLPGFPQPLPSLCPTLVTRVIHR